MAQSLPVALPPVDIVRELGDMLDPGVPRAVLDVGCGEGRNSVYLATLGHLIVGMTDKPEDLLAARQAAEIAGVSERCNFLQADVREALAAGMFDIILLNEVTHTMAKTAARSLLASVRSHTKQGGLNVVSGYVVRPGTANIANTRACFTPAELSDSYAHAGWASLSYSEEYLPNQYVGPGGREIISSRAKLIARRPWSILDGVVPRQRAQE